MVKGKSKDFLYFSLFLYTETMTAFEGEGEREGRGERRKLETITRKREDYLNALKYSSVCMTDKSQCI